MCAQPVIDLPTFTALMEAMGEDFIDELLQAYYDETPQLLAALQKALAAQDFETFQRSAHSIKSTSNTFGALHLGEMAKELEMMGKAKSLQGAGEKVAALTETYAQVRQTLEGLHRG